MKRFVGTWRLISCTWTDSAGRVSYPYGTEPVGYLIYTREGYMGVNFMSAHRRRYVSDDRFEATLAERRAGAKAYQAYSGTFEVRDNCVVHHVEVSLFPNWVGRDQERFFVFTGNRLTLSTAPLQSRGEQYLAELVWERVEGPLIEDDEKGEANGEG